MEIFTCANDVGGEEAADTVTVAVGALPAKTDVIVLLLTVLLLAIVVTAKLVEGTLEQKFSVQTEARCHPFETWKSDTTSAFADTVEIKSCVTF